MASPKKPKRTQLERAFRIFERLSPQHLASAELADLMGVPSSCAYFYTWRLCRAGCIAVRGYTPGWKGRRPLYGFVTGSTPPEDRRGKRPARVTLTQPEQPAAGVVIVPVRVPLLGGGE